MRTPTARSRGASERHTTFICLALLAAALFEIGGLVKDLRGISTTKDSEYSPDTRTELEIDASSRSHDAWAVGRSERESLQAIDEAYQSSAPSTSLDSHSPLSG
jgi:hypothetical protein